MWSIFFGPLSRRHRFSYMWNSRHPGEVPPEVKTVLDWYVFLRGVWSYLTSISIGVCLDVLQKYLELLQQLDESHQQKGKQPKRARFFPVIFFGVLYKWPLKGWLLVTSIWVIKLGHLEEDGEDGSWSTALLDIFHLQYHQVDIFWRSWTRLFFQILESAASHFWVRVGWNLYEVHVQKGSFVIGLWPKLMELYFATTDLIMWSSPLIPFYLDLPGRCLEKVPKISNIPKMDPNMVVKNGTASHHRIRKEITNKTSLLISLLLSHTNLFISKRKHICFQRITTARNPTK